MPPVFTMPLADPAAGLDIPRRSMEETAPYPRGTHGGNPRAKGESLGNILILDNPILLPLHFLWLLAKEFLSVFVRGQLFFMFLSF